MFTGNRLTSAMCHQAQHFKIDIQLSVYEGGYNECILFIISLV